MADKTSFYVCEICGNLVELIRVGGGELVCCGQPMNKLVANTVDADYEKHIPVVTRVDGKILAEVGSTIHPMIKEHFIEWIALVTDKSSQRILLKPSEEPKTLFEDQPGAEIEVYAFCNLHGLWKTGL